MTHAPGRACPLRQRLRERLDDRKPVCIRPKGITFLQNDKPNVFTLGEWSDQGGRADTELAESARRGIVNTGFGGYVF